MNITKYHCKFPRFVNLDEQLHQVRMMLEWKWSSFIFLLETLEIDRKIDRQIKIGIIWNNINKYTHTHIIYIYIYIYIYNVYIYIYIYGNHKTLIFHHGCLYYLVITRQKEQTIFCITFRYSPSSDRFTEGLFEVAIESWSEWDLIPRPLNSVQWVLFDPKKRLSLTLKWTALQIDKSN